MRRNQDGVAKDADVFVVGNVITRGNPLIEAILDSGRAVHLGPAMALRERAASDKWVLAVAGTHGKTTTAAMLAWILERTGSAPGFLIGGVPLNFGVSARLTDSAFFVIEADEYDTAFFDKRSKFVHYRPRTADPQQSRIRPRRYLCRPRGDRDAVPSSRADGAARGRLIVNGEDAALARVLARGCWSEIEYFSGASSLPPEGVRRRPGGSRSTAKVTHGCAPQGIVRWPADAPQLGRHNRLNALAAAVAAARHAGVPVDVGLAALQRVPRRAAPARIARRGARHHGLRRLRAPSDRDRGHDRRAAPREAAMRASSPCWSRARSTMKLGTMKGALPASLAGADRIYCYASNLGWDAAATLAPLGLKAAVHDDIDALVGAVAGEARSGDRVLVMSNGGFGGIHEKLLDALAG